MRKLTLLSIILILHSICFSCTEKRTDEVVTIDANENYPVLNLKLTDIAQISFIPLKMGKDSILLNTPAANRGNLLITEDKIFIGDRIAADDYLIVYNHQGDQLYTIGKAGRGPGEIIGSTIFTIDTLTNEVFLWGRMVNRLCVYDTNGNFKIDRGFDNNCNFLSFTSINPDLLFGFNESARMYTPDKFLNNSKAKNITDWGRSFNFFNKQDLLYNVDIPDFSFERTHSKNAFTGSNSLTNTKKGVYFFTGRSDTTYLLDNSLKIIPKFVDITEYGKELKGEIGIYPVLETDKYVFLTTYLSITKEPRKEKIKYLAYDKEKNKVYKIGESGRNGSKLPFLDNRVLIMHNYKSQNHNYIKVRLNYSFLKENYKKLPKKLKQITDRMTDNDNPVLMLIKFM